MKLKYIIGLIHLNLKQLRNSYKFSNVSLSFLQNQKTTTTCHTLNLNHRTNVSEVMNRESVLIILLSIITYDVYGNDNSRCSLTIFKNNFHT